MLVSRNGPRPVRMACVTNRVTRKVTTKPSTSQATSSRRPLTTGISSSSTAPPGQRRCGRSRDRAVAVGAVGAAGGRCASAVGPRSGILGGTRRRRECLVDDVVVIDTLAAVTAVSLLAAVVGGLFPRLPVPQVVLLLAGGMVLGPHVLDVGAAQDVRV